MILDFNMFLNVYVGRKLYIFSIFIGVSRVIWFLKHIHTSFTYFLLSPYMSKCTSSDF